MSEDKGNPYRAPGAKYPKVGPVVVVDNSPKPPEGPKIVARMPADFRDYGPRDQDIYKRGNRTRSKWMDY